MAPSAGLPLRIASSSLPSLAGWRLRNSASDQPSDRSHRPRDLIDTQSSAPLRGWKDVRQDCGSVREDESAASTLDQSEDDKCHPAWREAAEPRSDGEDSKAEGVQSHPPQHVREPPESEQQRCGDQSVTHDYPNSIEGACARKIRYDCGQRDQYYVRIQNRHEGTYGGVGKNDVLVFQVCFLTANEGRG